MEFDCQHVFQSQKKSSHLQNISIKFVLESNVNLAEQRI